MLLPSTQQTTAFQQRIWARPLAGQAKEGSFPGEAGGLKVTSLKSDLVIRRMPSTQSSMKVKDRVCRYRAAASAHAIQLQQTLTAKRVPSPMTKLWVEGAVHCTNVCAEIQTRMTAASGRPAAAHLLAVAPHLDLVRASQHLAAERRRSLFPAALPRAIRAYMPSESSPRLMSATHTGPWRLQLG